MKIKILYIGLIAGFVMMACIRLRSRPMIYPYSIKDLGTFGGDSSAAEDLNDKGDVVGYAKRADGHVHAFLYSRGVVRDLNPTAQPDSEAYGVNEKGEVAGVVSVLRPPKLITQQACLFDGGRCTILGSLGGTSNWTYRVNDSGAVAGDSFDTHHSQRPVLYYHGAIKDLGSLGGTAGQANAINGAGNVVGESEDRNGDKHAFLYSNGRMKDLGTLGGRCSRANGINEQGLVVGAADLKTRTMHAFLYTAGSMRDLGTLGGPVSRARSINRHNQIVGDVATSPESNHAFIYENGKMRDLNWEIDPHSGWVLEMANAINDRGQIVGVGTINGNEHGFLLTPSTR